MNISATVASEDGITFLVTVSSNVDMNEEVIWAVAGQALVADQGGSFSRLSRSYEAYDLKDALLKETGFTTIARFVRMAG